MVLAAAFGLTLAGVVFFEGLLLIRDFFVTAMTHLLGFRIFETCYARSSWFIGLV
jgi:fatty-acid desaturase